MGRVNGLAVVGANEGAVLAIEAAAFPVKSGQGRWQATGIVDQEEIDTGSRKILRKSTAAGALENVKTVLRRMGLQVDDYDMHIDFPGGMPVDGPFGWRCDGDCSLFCTDGSKDRRRYRHDRGDWHWRRGAAGGWCTRQNRAALRGGATHVLIPRENYERDFGAFPQVECLDTFEQVLRDLQSAGVRMRCQ